MAKGKFHQRGERLDYLNSSASDIEHFDVVAIGSRIGIAGADIEAGEVGAVYVEGVFELPKTDSTAINAGTVVYWDGTGITASADDGGSPATPYVPAGFATNAAAADDTTVLVKINA